MKKDSKEQINLLYNDRDTYESIRVDLASKLLEYEKEWGLEGYIVNDCFIRLDEYIAKPFFERNFPIHVKYFSEEEKKAGLKKSIEEEIDLAICHEPSVIKEHLNFDN